MPKTPNESEKKDWVGVYLTPKQLKTQLDNLACIASIAKKGKEKAIALRIEGKIGFHDKEKFIVAAKKEKNKRIENEINSLKIIEQRKDYVIWQLGQIAKGWFLARNGEWYGDWISLPVNEGMYNLKLQLFDIRKKLELKSKL